jgi:hypothetical protein
MFRENFAKRPFWCCFSFGKCFPYPYQEKADALTTAPYVYTERCDDCGKSFAEGTLQLACLSQLAGLAADKSF